MTAIQVRSATEADIPLILQFIQSKAAFDRQIGAFSGTLGTSEARIRATLFGAQPLAFVLFAIAPSSNTPVGFALYAFRYSSFAGQPSLWLDDLYVDAAHRSQGVGKQLMVKLAAIAQERNCSHLGWTADARNHRGLAFYRRLGAEVVRQEDNRCFLRWELLDGIAPKKAQPFTLRPASVDEDSIIARHFYQLWLDNGVAPEALYPNWEELCLSFIKQVRQELSYQAFVVEVDGQIVGSAGGQRFSGLYPIAFTPAMRADGYIWGVYVEADYRRRGIGQQLTEAVIGHLRAIGCTRAVLNAAPSGKSMYEQLGFQPNNSMFLML